jgi:hypothetical protein
MIWIAAIIMVAVTIVQNSPQVDQFLYLPMQSEMVPMPYCCQRDTMSQQSVGTSERSSASLLDSAAGWSPPVHGARPCGHAQPHVQLQNSATVSREKIDETGSRLSTAVAILNYKI